LKIGVLDYQKDIDPVLDCLDQRYINSSLKSRTARHINAHTSARDTDTEHGYPFGYPFPAQGEESKEKIFGELEFENPFQHNGITSVQRDVRVMLECEDNNDDDDDDDDDDTDQTDNGGVRRIDTDAGVNRGHHDNNCRLEDDNSNTETHANAYNASPGSDESPI
jgi:hypothetical protein